MFPQQQPFPAASLSTFNVQSTVGLVACCMCGAGIQPNATNMCVNCLKSQVDITEGISKQVTILYCKVTNRYHIPPTAWIHAELESKELLTFCIKRVKGLNKVKLVDAVFIWTEPHSKRLKVKLTIQKEVMNGAIVQQSFVVEYIVQYNLSPEAQKMAANSDQWIAKVQVRQKVEHKRTFFFLEQLILKHSADFQCIGVKAKPDGLDFFYNHRSHALKFIHFLQAVVPVRHSHAKQLVSHNDKNNTYNYKYTFLAEIVPLCREDMVCLPLKVSRANGGFGPLCVLTSMNTSFSLVDPFTLRVIHMDAEKYWREPFLHLRSSKQLIEYVVLDVEPVRGEQRGKYQLAEVQVAKASDFGVNDIIYTVPSHLGHILKPGDMALGYDLSNANLNNAALDTHSAISLPDVVLVRKSHEEARRRRKQQNRQRKWHLRRLEATEMEDDTKSQRGYDPEKEERDYERFLEELEEDPEMRSRVDIFKNPNAEEEQPMREGAMGEEGEGDEDEVPEIPLEEMLDRLTLNNRQQAVDVFGGEGEPGPSEQQYAEQDEEMDDMDVM